MWEVQPVFLQRSDYHLSRFFSYHVILQETTLTTNAATACDGAAVKDLDFKKNIEERYQIESTKIGEGGNDVLASASIRYH